MEIIRLKDVGIPPAVAKAVDVLRRGGIVLYPTDTIYGFGVDARNEEAVMRLKALKGRETKKPLSVLVADLAQMERCGEVNEAARALAKAHLPGPLTLVLPANPLMPESVMHYGTIGVRIPDDAFCLSLARAFDGPITSTSANLAGHGTPSNIDEILWHFGPKVSQIDLIIDGGELASDTPSTVVSCVTETPQVLREGALLRRELGLSQ